MSAKAEKSKGNARSKATKAKGAGSADQPRPVGQSEPREIARLARGGENAAPRRKVLRVFVLADRRAHDGAFVALIVKKALREASDGDYEAIVLPAGIGQYPKPFEVKDGVGVQRADVENEAQSWVIAFRRAFGTMRCPVVLGIDGDGVAKADTRGRRYGVQTAVAFDRSSLHLTFKSLHANAWERRWLVDPADGAFNRITRVGAESAALQVCHDGVVYSRRGEVASASNGRPAAMRAVMQPELEKGTLRIYNVLHQLPKKEAADSPLSPAFQSSHLKMKRLGHVVVAVSGIPRGRHETYFRRLSDRLACGRPSDDVLIDAS